MKYYTCSVCSSIGFHDDELDGKRICDRCLHKLKHGQDVYERCGLRGYHETWSSGGAIRTRQEGDKRYFASDVRCLCGVGVYTWLLSPGGGLIPSPPRYWQRVAGKLVPFIPPPPSPSPAVPALPATPTDPPEGSE